MKNIKALIGILTFTGSLFGQDTIREFKLKTFWNYQSRSNGIGTISSSLLSFGVELKSKENNFHEIELNELEIGSNSPTNSSRLSLALNYEYNLRLFKKSKKMNYYLGLGVNPKISRIRYKPYYYTGFDYLEDDMSTYITLVPRVKFRLNKKIGFEIKMPIGLLAMESYTRVNSNPSIPEDSQKTSNYFIYGLLGSGGDFYSRLSFGINYKFNNNSK